MQQLHGIPVAGFKEMIAVPLRRQVFPLGVGGVLGIFSRFKIHIIQIHVVRGKGPGNVGVGRAFVLIILHHRQHSHGNGCRAGDGIYGHPADEGVHRSVFRHFFIHDDAVALPAAAHHGVQKGGTGRVRHQVMIHGLADVQHAENPEHKITVGFIAAHILRPGSVHLQNGDGNGVEIAAQGFIAVIGKHGHIVQVDAADGGVVFRLTGVFKADLKRVFFYSFNNFRFRNGLAVIIPLQLRAADLLQEFHLFFLFYALADGFHAQAHAHFHQLGQDDAVLLTASELLHEAHIKFDQVEMNVLQHIQRRIAAAEIVHPHPEAQFLETGDLLFDKLKIAAYDAFGDFNGQLGAADARFVHPTANFLHDITAFKIRP